VLFGLGIERSQRDEKRDRYQQSCGMGSMVHLLYDDAGTTIDQTPFR
jgi:hypothetical protein